MATEGGLPRFPDIGFERIVFTAGGDLWWVPVEGGVANRLTTHQGLERFARISPDGEWIAYTAEYEGDSDVWVIPFDGGAAKRLTWHSGGQSDDVTWDWTVDGKILFSSGKQSISTRFSELYTVGLDGGLATPLATSDVGPSKIAPDGSIIFNRFFRNFRTWKRYTGGSQQDLWRYDPKTETSQRLTEWPGTDTQPMIAADGTMYFVSDRPEVEGTYSTRNIFRYVESGKAEQLTEHADFDVYWPSIDQDLIVYMHGADLRVFDVKTKEDRLLELEIPDEALQTRPYRKVLYRWNVEDLSLGPQGKRTSIVAHGDLFTVPTKEGDWRLVSGGSEGRITESIWSPDGKKIAFISDESGEQEIWTVAQSGREPAEQLTKGNQTWIKGIRWSADGGRILYNDKRMRLWEVDVGSGVKTVVDKGESSDIAAAEFSADGNWIAYVKPEENGYGSLWLHDIKRRQNHRITSTFNDDFDLAWDPEGRYLYFISRRNFDLVRNVFEFRMVHRLTDLIYVIRLKKDGPDPIEPLSDEEVDDDGAPVFDEDPPEEKKKAKKKKRKKEQAVVLPAPSMGIDIDGIEDRVQRLPLEPGRYWGLQATEDGLFYLTSPAVMSDGDRELYRYDMDEQETEWVASDVLGYQLAAGHDKLLFLSGDGYYHVTDADADAGRGDMLSFSGLATWTDPQIEWHRTLDEVRRFMRDYFYDPNMHGQDWDAIHARYDALLDRATVPADVIWLIGEMIGELNVGHAYVYGGWTGVSTVNTAKLGAELVDDGTGILIKRIYKGEPANPSRESPLRRPGVDVEEGDYLISIDGRELKTGDNPHQWLVGTAGHPLRLMVNSRPDQSGAREVTVRPIRSDYELRYWDWVETNRKKVAEATDGRVGYVHLPDTAKSGYTEFIRGLYAQHRLDGLVIDVRYNGGGYIPDMFIEHLMRPHFNTWVPRDGADWRTPSVAVHGPKICITNGYAGSGGDAFPYYFREFKLGKLVGTTTWGGLVGISEGVSLLIGGWMSAPSFAFVNPEG
ncbi:MAG: hypothetical protein HN348_08380, partial [Proteobacteria bacterium]|nr:hypothetical protein [Pseudomonadota bacterium]